MFAKTIIDSDVFLDMPLSAQALYFHLSMRADDDGFINNPRKIQRMIGASDDDCKLLIAKRFILTFESGVIVIKHWKIHNYIQRDRYKPTVYQKEMALLSENENRAYTECIHDVSMSDTQVRIGEDSIELVEDRVEKGKLKVECAAIPQQILDLYNSICPDRNRPTVLPCADMLNDKRKQKIEESLKLYGIDDFKRCFELASRSSFLKGNNKRKWCASFDWLIDSANMAKVLAGNYTDNSATSFDVDDFYNAALAKSYAEMPKTAADDPAIQERAERLKEKLG